MLGAIDTTILVLYLVGVIALGLRVGRSRATTSLEGYLLGGHRIPWWAVLGSIIAAEVTAASFLGIPGEAFESRNYVYCQLAFGMMLGRIVVSRLFIKAYFDHRVQSIYELLAIRFGPITRNCASFLFLTGRSLGTGVRIYIGGVVLVVIWRSRFGSEISWTADCAAIFAVIALTAVYTILGGIRAVIYTDLVQALLMAGGAAGALAYLYRSLPQGLATVHAALGGVAPTVVTLVGSGVFRDPYTVFSALIGMVFLTLASHGTDQDLVQRMLAARNSGESRRALVLSGIVDIPIAFVFATIGIFLFAHYRIHPDATLPRSANEIFAHYIVHELPPGLRGFVVSALLATIMGSTSAALNSLSTSFIKDWYIPYFARAAGEPERVRAAKWATAGFAVLAGVVAALASLLVHQDPEIRVLPIALGLLGFCYGSLLGIFLLAVLTKDRGSDRANALAMLAGIVAVAIAAWLGLAWSWYALAGSIVTFSCAYPFRNPAENRA